MTEQSLKNQAEEIIIAVDQDLQAVDSKAVVVQENVKTRANALMDTIFNVVSDVDLEEAADRVNRLREENPELSVEVLAQQLIRDKCQRTGLIGAATSGAGLIPGIGTAAAVTLGVAADIGATFKLQAELVLELAALYDYPLTDEEKQRVVMVITGISAGTTALARRAGQTASIKIGEKVAQKSVIKALPIVGVVASSGTNVLSTYIIGQRADTYFRLGPEAVGSWADSLRAISGVDERKIGSWLAENGKNTGAALVSGATKVGLATKSAGITMSTRATEMAGNTGTALNAGATKAGNMARRGARAYVQQVIKVWRPVLRFLGKILGFIWGVLSFIPRKIGGVFRRN